MFPSIIDDRTRLQKLFAPHVLPGRQVRYSDAHRTAPGDVLRITNTSTAILSKAACLRSRALCGEVPSFGGFRTKSNVLRQGLAQCFPSSRRFHQPIQGKFDNLAVPVPAGNCFPFNGVAFFPQLMYTGRKAGNAQPESGQCCHFAMIQ